MGTYLTLSILVPCVAGLASLLLFRRQSWTVAAALTLAATAANLLIAIRMFGNEFSTHLPAGAYGITLSLRLYHFSGFILLAAAGFGFLLALYSLSFMKGREHLNQFYAYFLITLGLVNGAVLSDNLILLLFFWEGLLLTLFGMIAIGNKGAYKTAVKAFVLSGVADLCMMIGVGLTIFLAKTATLSDISLTLGTPTSTAAFLLLMTGAIAKAGSMPFHSWIPDAASDAPLPFMALVPASLEKLLGIYFLSRITLDLFKLTPGSSLSIVMMTIGCITILLAVLMALIQKDYKRMLSFHAISQVGYMILGIGTAVPVGIVGGIFHMVNHAMYKSCLFLTGGSVEKQAGTTEFSKLGGLAKAMPVTFICFVVAAASISGVPPFNGFFSKELVYDGALERGRIFYAAALLGSFLTAASFLKLGHSVFLGKPAANRASVKESPLSMLIPMITIAGFCVLFGVYNPLPLQKLIQPILGERLEGHDFSGMHGSPLLIGMTVVVLVAALLNHLFGVKRSGRALGAADHIRHAPGLETIYDKAELRWFDPYEIGMKLARGIAAIGWRIDRMIDFLYNVFAVEFTFAFVKVIRRAHNGNYAVYLGWTLAGLALAALYVLGSM